MEVTMLHILNAFSIQMLPEWGSQVSIKRVSTAAAKEIVKSWRDSVQSHIGHTDTAQVLSDIFEKNIPMCRDNLEIEKSPNGDEQYLVCQLYGGRLPEGTTQLPEGYEFRFFEITILKNYSKPISEEEWEQAVIGSFYE
jgi:hypothetical protein